MNWRAWQWPLAGLAAAIRDLSLQNAAFEDRMTTATDKLNIKIDDLTSAVTEALAQMESEVVTIKKNAATADDSAVVNASADRIGALSATIRSAMQKARDALSIATVVAPAAPASASTAPPVALAGVPVTPVSTAGLVSTGPAVPSVDSNVTDNSPNKETSAPASFPTEATARVSGT